MPRPHLSGVARGLPALVLAITMAGWSPASAQEEQGYRAFPHLIPAGDLDADGLSDTVSFEREPGESVGPAQVGSTSVITARRGSDGTVLWEHIGSADALLPGPLGPGGAPGVLAVTGDFVGNYGVGASSEGQAFGERVELRDLVLTALSAQGSVLWERQFDDGVFAGAAVVDYNMGRKQAVVAQAHPSLVGTLQATPSPAMDMLVTVTSRREVADEIESTLETVVIDGATGESASTVTVETQTRPSARLAGDLDGDGLDDFVVLRDPTSGGLAARRGRDGSVLWSNPDDVVPFFPYVDDLGDLTGDGAEDLAVRGSGDVYDEGPPRVTVLDGATGAALLTETGNTVSPAGDADADGRIDLLIQRLVAHEVRYRLLDLEGAELAQRAFPVPDEDGVSIELTPDVGDLDDDGVSDGAHRVTRTSEAGEPLAERTVVSGRTLGRGFQGPAGEPLMASLDGTGDDLVLVRRSAADTVSVTAQDGATGAPIWVRDLPAPAEFPGISGVSVATARVDGDEVPDVVLNVQFYRIVDESPGVSRLESFVRAWVLRGTGGATLWTV